MKTTKLDVSLLNYIGSVREVGMWQKIEADKKLLYFLQAYTVCKAFSPNIKRGKVLQGLEVLTSLRNIVNFNFNFDS